MFGAILKATKSSFQKGMTFCRSIYVKKVMKLLAFIFEQPSYSVCYCVIFLVILTLSHNYLSFGDIHNGLLLCYTPGHTSSLP